VKTSDLDLLCTLSAPSVSADGRRVVFSMSRPDQGADAYVGQLWRVPADGSTPPVRFTRGFRDTAPQFSPDGLLVAFLRAAAPDGRPQLQVVRAEGGEPLALTDQLLGVSEFAWSPDSRRLVFVARAPDPGRYGSITGISPAAEPPRRITTTRYLSNGVGVVVDQRAQLFLVDVPDVTGEPFVPPAPSREQPALDPGAGSGLPTSWQLTGDDADHAHARFSPDGRSVTFVAESHDGRADTLRSAAYRLELAADGSPGDLTEVVGPEQGLYVAQALDSPNGATFVLGREIDPETVDFVGKNTALHVLDHGGAAVRRLTDLEVVDLQDSSLTLWGEDAVLVQNTTRGSVQLLRVEATGSQGQLSTGPVVVQGVAAAGDVVVVTLSDAGSGGDVAVLVDGHLRRLTDFSAPVRAAGLVPAEELVATARDGQEVHGWVLEPPGAGPHPTLLVIHGGPFAQYTGALFDEAQVYAAAGYGVVMCNPRGAAGYGQAFGRTIKQRLGTVDMTDVLDFLDGALGTHPALDGERVGIMGGSYGGYLTAWTIAHEHRFAGAIVERGFLDPELFIGTSDIGTYFSEQYTGADPALRRAQSPQAVVGRVRTPTLVLHSEDDLRCPLSQAQRYHLGLVRAGVESEMLLFPGENHELTRSGRPRHRVQRFEAILDWWDRFLPVPT
jgi:dipeptidyl aminopeptidase/acylaminoacyl peptidase